MKEGEVVTVHQTSNFDFFSKVSILQNVFLQNSLRQQKETKNIPVRDKHT